MLVHGLQIQKQTNASGGFKVPQEMVQRRAEQRSPPRDLPSKDEIYQQLGIAMEDSSRNIPSSNMIAASRQMILKKVHYFKQKQQEQISQLPPKPSNVQVIKKPIPSKKLTSDDIQTMIDEHRKTMNPLQEAYSLLKMESGNKSKRSVTPKVKVTHHSPVLNKSVDKLREHQKDVTGPHSGFLQGVLPKQELQRYHSESKIIADEDYQMKFKNYLRNKSKDSNENIQKEFELYQSTSPNPDRWTKKHKHPVRFRGRTTNSSKSNKSISKSKSKSLHKAADEDYLLEQFFNGIDQNKALKIDKLQTIKYLVKNRQIMEAFNIQPKELNSKINNFPTKDANCFMLKEFKNFMKKQKSQIEHETFGSLSHISQADKQSGCLLKEQQIHNLKKVFDQMAIDMIAPRQDFIKALRNDINVVRILHVQAAYVAQIDKILTLDKVLTSLAQIQDDYISWKQFLDGFEYNMEVSKQKVSYAQIQDLPVDDQDKVDAPKELQQLIHEQFEILRQDDYVYTQDIIDSIRRAPLYSQLRRQQMRPNENLEQLLERIMDDAHDYITEPELIQYFTRRGTPKFEEEIASLAKSVNVTEAYRESNNLDGYDSDPELHTYQDRLLPRQRVLKNSSSQQQGLLTHSHHKHASTKSLPRQKDDEFLKSIQPRKGQFGAHSKPSDYHFKVTQPKPYNFDQRPRSTSIRQKRVSEMIEEKKFHPSPFRAKEVPAHVKEPLFEQIMKQNEDRRQQIKQNSVKITLQNEKPFSFYKRDKEHPRRKNNYEREKFIFHAKAIPWHVHVNLLEQMRSDEETKRQERIAKHAQELAMSSKMPARMEQHERQKQAQLPSPKYAQPPQNVKAKQMPDFQRLHSSFQESLNRKKQQMRTTDPQPFNFQQSHKGLDRDYLDLENTQKIVIPHEDKIVEARRKMDQKPVKQPPTTKKFDDYQKLLKSQRQAAKDQEEQLKKEEQQRAEKKEAFKKTFHQNSGIKESKTEEQRKVYIEKKRQENKEQEKKQKQRIEDAKRKAAEQPLLINRLTKRDAKMEKMKQLEKMDKILKTKGIVNRDEYFNKEERALLQDVDYLKKHGYDDDFEKDE